MRGGPSEPGASSHVPRSTCSRPRRAAPRRCAGRRAPPRHVLPVHLHASARGLEMARAPRTTRSPGRMPPAPERAGDDGAEALHREDAVDRQARRARRPGARQLGQTPRRARRSSASRPAPVLAETGDDRRARRTASRRGTSRTSSAHESSQSGSTRSLLVSATTPRVTPSSRDDVEVLAGLRHHALVGGDDEQHDVDRRRRRRACS